VDRESCGHQYDRGVARLTAAGVALTLVSLVIPACGESDAPSRADYIAKADYICAAGETTLTINGRDARFPSEGTAESNRDRAEDQQATLDELEALGSPSDQSGVIDEWLEARTEQIDVQKAGADALEAGDRAEVSALTDRYVAARRQEWSAAKDYGFKVCSQPVSDYSGTQADAQGNAFPHAKVFVDFGHGMKAYEGRVGGQSVPCLQGNNGATACTPEFQPDDPPGAVNLYISSGGPQGLTVVFARDPASSVRLDFYESDSRTIPLMRLPAGSPFRVATHFAIARTPGDVTSATSLDSEGNELATENAFEG
jgi:hypothetical protein